MTPVPYAPSCALPLRPRVGMPANRTTATPAAVTLAEWLSDQPPRGPVDPDAPGDNVDRLCTQISYEYRPTSHAVEPGWNRPRVVRTVCGPILARSKVWWVSRPVDCDRCLAILRSRDLGLGQT